MTQRSDQPSPAAEPSGPYELLGVPADAGFDEVQAAKLARLDEVGDDTMARSRIEVAYDSVLMERLKERQQGRVSSAAMSASQREQLAPPPPKLTMPALPQLQLPRVSAPQLSLPGLSLATLVPTGHIWCIAAFTAYCSRFPSGSGAGLGYGYGCYQPAVAQSALPRSCRLGLCSSLRRIAIGSNLGWCSFQHLAPWVAFEYAPSAKPASVTAVATWCLACRLIFGLTSTNCLRN
jgi:hypothetical protein